MLVYATLVCTTHNILAGAVYYVDELHKVKILCLDIRAQGVITAGSKMYKTHQDQRNCLTVWGTHPKGEDTVFGYKGTRGDNGWKQDVQDISRSEKLSDCVGYTPHICMQFEYSIVCQR